MSLRSSTALGLLVFGMTAAVAQTGGAPSMQPPPPGAGSGSPGASGPTPNIEKTTPGSGASAQGEKMREEKSSPSAQGEKMREEKSGSAQTPKPSSTDSSNRKAESGKDLKEGSGSSAEGKKLEGGKSAEGSKELKEGSGTSAEGKDLKTGSGSSAEGKKLEGGKSAEGGKRMESGRSAASVTLSTEQRSTIRTRLVTKDVQRVNVDISVGVGAVVPVHVRTYARPIPVWLVEIVPEYRDLVYIVLADGRIVFLEPASYEVVTIITV